MLVAHPRWLLCRADHYDVQYEINSWMKIDRQPDRVIALKQWQKLDETIRSLGVTVEYIEPQQGLPDMVFTANGGLVVGNRCVLSKFRYAERQGEEQFFESWFLDHGFDVKKLTSGYFEGEGDAFPMGSMLIAGYGFRSDLSSYQEIAKFLNIPTIVPVHLVNSYFYHLDTCFAPLNDSQALIFAEAFAPESVSLLEKHIELIRIPENDARRFACNAVVLGNNIIVPSGCPSTYELLQKRGFTVHPVEVDEYIKAGGAAKCLTLRV